MNKTNYIEKADRASVMVGWLELDSAGFEMHTSECLCSLNDNDEDCTCGAYRRNQELIAEGNDPDFMWPI